jgi:hypothetical protein
VGSTDYRRAAGQGGLVRCQQYAADSQFGH